MIEVRLVWSGDYLISLESRGHSGYAEAGGDIICAGVSSLVQALALGLNNIAKLDKLECVMNKKTPVIKLSWPKERAADLDLLTRSVALALKQIAAANKSFVNITEVKL